MKSVSFNDLKTKVKEHVLRIFPERQLYFRADGRVRLLTFTPKHQLVGSTAALALVGWMAVTSFHFFDRNADLDRKERRLQEMMESYQALDAEMRHMQQTVIETARRLDARQELLNASIPVGPADEGAVEVAVPGPQAQLQPVETKPGSRFFRWFRNEQETTTSLASIEADLAGIATQQQVIASRLIELTDKTLSSYNEILSQTGISKDRLLKVAAVGQAHNKSVGGPFIPNEALTDGFHAEDGQAQDGQDALSQLFNRRNELLAIDAVLENTPLLPPVHVERISSGFGGRSDPFNGRRAVHNGLDLLPKDMSAPILVQAPGVVTKAGWNGPYGRFVEIDHGNGFTTRYGHLRKITVQKGDKLTLNSPIGYVGSSGRSTGPHLHYEIWFGGRSLNPLNFFKIAHQVQELRQSNPQITLAKPSATHS